MYSKYFMAISNKVGPPVTGKDFYGRIKELANTHDGNTIKKMRHFSLCCQF